VAGRGGAFESSEGADGYLRLLRRFTTSRLAIISWVDGVASGGGVGLVAASDYALCSPGAKFRLPEALWGLLPCLVAPFLIRRVGPQACRRLAMFGEHTDALQAERCGLVDAVGDEKDLQRLLRRIRNVAPESTGNLKDYLNRIAPIDELTFEVASSTLNSLLSSSKVLERLKDFSERGRLPWEGGGAVSATEPPMRPLPVRPDTTRRASVATSTPRRCWMFSGQGSQKRGMGADVIDDFPTLVERADDILGYSVRQLCLLDPDDRLSRTEFAQPALFIVSALSFLQRRREEAWPDILAGHSLGEYAALFAAGAFDFETGLRLVKRRGELMETTRTGAMLAVIGPRLDELLEMIARLELGDIDIASYNLPTQTVVSGPLPAIEGLANFVAERELGRTVHMFIGGASHGRLAEPAARAFEAELERHELRDPAVPVMSNVTGRPYEAGTLRTLLSQQMRVPVQWQETMTSLHAAGVTDVRQVGPGRALLGLWEQFNIASRETREMVSIHETSC
jgi:malonyl CoA-acyl carrier protein transacylase